MDGKRIVETIGRVGLWSFALERHPIGVERDALAEIESLGFKSVWVPEGFGSKDALAHSALLLAGSSSIVIATGIASIWARDPFAMANGARLLGEGFPGRFLLGIGVSHRTSVDRRGASRYERPLARMRAYLDGMDGARYPVSEPVQAPPVVLAALGPGMLKLAAERTAGAHPYFTPVGHTAFARETMGPGPLLAPELAVVLESDPEVARRIARDYMRHYLKLENYANNLLRMGWKREDIDGSTGALVDAIVAWGDADAIRKRVHEHLDAGADHVCVQVLVEDPKEIPLRQLRELAPALLG